MSKKLQGKIALVTGGNSGIGLATARRFVDEGAFVYISGRRQTELDAAVGSLGPSARAIRSDASRLAEIDALFDQIAREKGRLDVLFVNAGAAAFSPLAAITEEHFDHLFGVNVKGVVFTVQRALPLLSEGAAIVLNASIESIKGKPSLSVYSATKAAVRSFARGWTSDLKGRKIRVNVVSPGSTETPGLEGLAGARSDEQRRGLYAHLAADIPLGRVAQPDDIARSVVFLASDDASFITGVELFVDGGAVQV